MHFKSFSMIYIDWHYLSLQNSGISAINIVAWKDLYFLVTGSVNGGVSIYDMSLKILWWVDVVKYVSEPLCGSIVSIVFDYTTMNGKANFL